MKFSLGLTSWELKGRCRDALLWISEIQGNYIFRRKKGKAISILCKIFARTSCKEAEKYV